MTRSTTTNQDILYGATQPAPKGAARVAMVSAGRNHLGSLVGRAPKGVARVALVSARRNRMGRMMSWWPETVGCLGCGRLRERAASRVRGGNVLGRVLALRLIRAACSNRILTRAWRCMPTCHHLRLQHRQSAVRMRPHQSPKR